MAALLEAYTYYGYTYYGYTYYGQAWKGMAALLEAYGKERAEELLQARYLVITPVVRSG